MRGDRHGRGVGTGMPIWNHRCVGGGMCFSGCGEEGGGATARQAAQHGAGAPTARGRLRAAGAPRTPAYLAHTLRIPYTYLTHTLHTPTPCSYNALLCKGAPRTPPHTHTGANTQNTPPLQLRRAAVREGGRHRGQVQRGAAQGASLCERGRQKQVGVNARVPHHADARHARPAAGGGLRRRPGCAPVCGGGVVWCWLRARCGGGGTWGPRIPPQFLRPQALPTGAFSRRCARS